MDDATGLSVEFVVNQFQVLKRTNDALTPTEFFQSKPSVSQQAHVVPVVIADIKSRIRNHQPVDLESYFSQLPELNAHQDVWQILDAADPWMIEHQGLDWRQQWLERLPANERHASTNHTSPTPRAGRDLERLQSGDRILDFEIRRLIGRGTYGVVYLASNLSLGRDVALKITSGSGTEGRALARLNHENIVSVYGEHAIENKRILEMQFVQGSDLEQWNSEEKNLESAERVGNAAAQYTAWAARCPTDTSGSDREVGPDDDNPVKSPANLATAKRIPNFVRSRAEVAAWIVSQLADAMQHAHDRGILHQDIKPANVLIDTSGTPLITDFNVAFISGQSERDAIGGTVNYMSPEQLQAYCSGDADSIHAVDLKSDLYSLGIVLLELLGGQKVWGNVTSTMPEPMARQLLAARLKPAPSRTAELPGVNHSLAAIVDKALQPKPLNRYQTASEFATDLTRWLAGQSNLHAANPNFTERLSRYCRRQKLTVAGSLLALTVAGGLLFGWTKWESSRLADCQQLLTSCEAAAMNGRGSLAAEQLGEAKARLDQLWITPWVDPSALQRVQLKADHCSEQVMKFELFRFTSLFRQANLVSIHHGESNRNDNHDLVAESLKSYRVMSDPNWQQQPPFSQLSPVQKTQVAENITELMLVSMINSSETSTPDAAQWRQVLDRLPDEHQSLQVFELLKSSSEIPHPSGKSHANIKDFESYLLGIWASSRDQNEKAYDWFASAINQRKVESRERFWLRYRQGLTCQRISRHDQAILHYAVCLGMRPDFAWIPFNMALVHIQMEQPEEAVQYLRRAIVLDSKLSAAYVALGAIQCKAQNYQAALETCDRGLEAGVIASELAEIRDQAKSKLNLDLGRQ